MLAGRSRSKPSKSEDHKSKELFRKKRGSSQEIKISSTFIIRSKSFSKERSTTISKQSNVNDNSAQKEQTPSSKSNPPAPKIQSLQTISINKKTCAVNPLPRSMLDFSELSIVQIRHVIDQEYSLGSATLPKLKGIQNGGFFLHKTISKVTKTKNIQTREYNLQSNFEQPEYFHFSYPDPTYDELPLKFWGEVSQSMKKLLKEYPISYETKLLSVSLVQRIKPILALELNETLVHCCNSDGPDATWDTTISYYSSLSRSEVEVTLNIRPFTNWFLKEVGEHFEVVVFTSSERDYAKAVCKLLDPFGKLIKKIFARPQCIPSKTGYYLKDLQVLSGDDWAESILVDGSPESYHPQIKNRIPILSYFDGKNDTELKKLFSFLLMLKSQPSIPNFLQKYFGLDRLAHCSGQKAILRHLLSVGFKRSTLHQ